MPTYAYACTECEHRFDIVQSFSEDSLTQCPQCDGRLRKLFNAVGVVFKGSGFYRNDSRTDSRARSSSGIPASDTAGKSGESSGSKESSQGGDSSGSKESSQGGASSGSKDSGRGEASSGSRDSSQGDSSKGDSSSGSTSSSASSSLSAKAGSAA